MKKQLIIFLLLHIVVLLKANTNEENTLSYQWDIMVVKPRLLWDLKVILDDPTNDKFYKDEFGIDFVYSLKTYITANLSGKMINWKIHALQFNIKDNQAMDINTDISRGHLTSPGWDTALVSKMVIFFHSFILKTAFFNDLYEKLKRNEIDLETAHAEIKNILKDREFSVGKKMFMISMYNDFSSNKTNELKELNKTDSAKASEIIKDQMIYKKILRENNIIEEKLTQLNNSDLSDGTSYQDFIDFEQAHSVELNPLIESYESLQGNSMDMIIPNLSPDRTFYYRGEDDKPSIIHRYDNKLIIDSDNNGIYKVLVIDAHNLNESEQKSPWFNQTIILEENKYILDNTAFEIDNFDKNKSKQLNIKIEKDNLTIEEIKMIMPN